MLKNHSEKIILIDGLGHEYKVDLNILKIILKTGGITHLGTRLRTKLLLKELIKIDLPKNARILDAGCSYGFISLILAQKKYQVYGIDIDKNRIKTAKIIAKHNNLKINYLNESIYHLPFRDNYFDLVICFEVLEHLADDKKAVGELFRVTKKNGILIFSLPYPHKNAAQYRYYSHVKDGYSSDDFKKIITNNYRQFKFLPYGQTSLGRLVFQYNFWLWYLSPYLGLGFFPFNYFLTVVDQKLPANGQPEGNLAVIKKA